MTEENMALTKAECEQWISDLRSGKFRQGTGALISDCEGGGVAYCCLGVLMETQGKPASPVDSDYYLHGKVLPHRTQKNLGAMNDHGESFRAIANHIEKYILPRRK